MAYPPGLSGFIHNMGRAWATPGLRCEQQRAVWALAARPPPSPQRMVLSQQVQLGILVYTPANCVTWEPPRLGFPICKQGGNSTCSLGLWCRLGLGNPPRLGKPAFVGGPGLQSREGTHAFLRRMAGA